MIVNFVVAKSKPTDLVSHQAVQQLTCVRYFSFIQALLYPPMRTTTPTKEINLTNLHIGLMP